MPLDLIITDALALWEIPQTATARLINVSENRTYMVETPAGDFKAVLRVHRQGYHSRAAIESELAWTNALNNQGLVLTPAPIAGCDGQQVQTYHDHFMVLFDFVEGQHPNEAHNPLQLYKDLGAVAARCHLHAMTWRRPADFTRLTWDLDTVFGPDAHWGNWRYAPNVTPEIAETLEQVEGKIRQRLSTYGKSSERFGLIHADMRFANLLVDGTTTHVIDFDDCGFSWFMYDFASTISFIEDHPDIPKFKQAWLQGYRQVRDLTVVDEAEIDTFIMLRRMALLAWIGSHMEATEPQALAPDFAQVTADLGGQYLNSNNAC